MQKEIPHSENALIESAQKDLFNGIQSIYAAKNVKQRKYYMKYNELHNGKPTCESCEYRRRVKCRRTGAVFQKCALLDMHKSRYSSIRLFGRCKAHTPKPEGEPTITELI